MTQRADRESFAAPLIIRGGRLVDPAAGVDEKADLLLKNGRVVELAAAGRLSATATGIHVFDATGLVVAPGFIDLHVHLREPGQQHKETIATGTAAAAAGGFTSVCAMPNTFPVNDSPEITAWMRHPDRGAVVNVFPVAAATHGSMGERLTDYRGLQRAGAVALTDDGKPVLDDAIMLQALRRASALKMPVIQHAEDTRMTAGCSMNYGPPAFRLGLRGMPPEAETRVVERDIELARRARAHLHVAHISTAAAVEAVRQARRAGVRVTCEVTPHHFTLSDSDITGYDTAYKMNPPLRSLEDRQAMLQGLADGTIDAIATDHAPHAPHEKQVEFDRAAFGIIGLETALALALSALHGQGMPLARLIELFTSGPARVLGKPLVGRGTLAPGSHADLTIFDPAGKWTFTAAESRSKSRNTPFDGRRLVGRVIATIVAGRIVYSGERAQLRHSQPRH